MQISVSDGKGTDFILHDTFYRDNIGNLLVAELREVYSFPFGDAELVRLTFPGIYIVYGDMVMKEARQLHFSMEDHTELVEMHFSLLGSGVVVNDLNGGTYDFRPNEHNMHYTPDFKGSGEYEENARYKFFEVHFTKQFFLELAQSGSPGLRRFAEMIAAGKVSQFSRSNMPISFAMHQCIRDVMNCSCEGGLKLLFLQSKCIELLTLQAQMYENTERKIVVSPSIVDKDRICFARDYLVDHVLQPPSLTELAKIAGINEFKLKQGFKQVFNNTVYGYLSDYKLEQAREQLLGGHIAIKEVADHLGYSSVQHFSNAFRKKFGLPPGQVRK
ncbi:AraC family transcriptional regulator [Paraflavitalea sp. CAU 1676]|uniref:helix-turn-helix transcriptional regulator n=1 Tax=Paraflavitalea sp. CAU 1676 TaxID=3032598 RepID=UPI0023DABAE0|nr:AraC family transcriptional regulator [Paraflavitalea sp. CAU 1676]MDF2188250.1 AraC family transcriptional regulator [Paraflavitalea sp. CAU 1676]